MTPEKRGVLCGETRLIDSLPEFGRRVATDVVKCAHVHRTGKRCTKMPLDGEELCVLHGGSIEGAGIEVRRRMLALQLQSLDVAEELMALGDDKVRASLIVATWDRTGLGPKSTLEVTEHPEDLSILTREQLALRAEAAARRLRSLNQRMNEDTDVNDAATTH